VFNRIYAVQSKLLEKIAERKGESTDRDWPLDWERIHMISCAKVGQYLAARRGVNTELAAIACAVHDYGRILSGKQKNHAVLGYEPVKEFLISCGYFSEAEIEIVAQAAKLHSNKSEVGSPLEEVVKDADVLDCFEYGIDPERPEQRSRLENIMAELKSM